MKIESLSITIGRTLNDGNYGTRKVEATVSASLDSTDTIEAVREKLIDEGKKSLVLVYKNIYEND